MISEDLMELISLNEGSKVLTKPEEALRSKMESQIRAIRNLEEKQKRLALQVRTQKRSLARKREELKKANRSTGRRLRTQLEQGTLDESANLLAPLVDRIDNQLFLETAQILED